MKEEVTDVAVGLDTHLKKMGGIAKVQIFYGGWYFLKQTRMRKKQANIEELWDQQF